MPDYDQLVALINKISVAHGSATRLHSVLEDLNLDDDIIQGCLDREELNADERPCAEQLLALDYDARVAVVNQSNYGPVYD